MKKLMFLPVICLLLTGCGYSNNPYSIRIYQNIDIEANESSSAFVKISNSDLTALISSNSTFALFLYSESCTYCESAKETLTTYVKNSNYLFYSYEYVAQSYGNLANAFPDIFPLPFSSPSLYLISEQSLTYSFDTKVLLNYSKFRPIASQHIFTSPIQTFVEQSSFDFIIENGRDGFVFVYDNYSTTSLSIFNKMIYPLMASDMNKNITLINKYLLKNNVFSSISQYYQIDIDSTNIAIYKNKNGDIVSTLYLLDDGLELDSLIKTYLGE